MSGISVDFACGTTPTPAIVLENIEYQLQNFKTLTFAVRLVEPPDKFVPVSKTIDPSLSVSPSE